MNALYRRTGWLLSYLAWPVLYVYLRRGARTRVLVIAKDHVLLVRGWIDNGGWSLPGGGLHSDEDPLDGALREVREETGVILQKKQLTPLGSEWLHRRGLKAFHHLFAAYMNDMVPTAKQRGEIVAVEWFPLAELSRIPHKPEVDRALELLADR